MEWYTILGLSIGTLSIVVLNILINRRKWKKWMKVWGDGQRNEEDFTAMKEAIKSIATVVTEIMALLGVLKKTE